MHFCLGGSGEGGPPAPFLPLSWSQCWIRVAPDVREGEGRTRGPRPARPRPPLSSGSTRAVSHPGAPPSGCRRVRMRQPHSEGGVRPPRSFREPSGCCRAAATWHLVPRAGGESRFTETSARRWGRSSGLVHRARESVAAGRDGRWAPPVWGAGPGGPGARPPPRSSLEMEVRGDAVSGSEGRAVSPVFTVGALHPLVPVVSGAYLRSFMG